MTSRPSSPWLIGGLFLAAYVAILSTLSPGVFYSPDSGGKFLQMIGYHWANGLQCEIIYPSKEMDPDLSFYGTHAERAAFTAIHPYRDENGSVHTGWTPWFSLLSLPFYRAFGVAGLHVVPLAAGFLLIAMTGLLAERLRPGSEVLASCVVGGATPVLFYSLCFWEHTLATALLLAALLPLARARFGTSASAVRPIQACLSAIGMAAACAVRRELIFFLGASLLAWGWVHPRPRRVLPVVLAALLVIGAGGLALLLAHPDLLRWLFPSGVDNIHWLKRLQDANALTGFGTHLIQLLLVHETHVLLPDMARWAGLLGLALCLGTPLAPARWRRGMVLTGAALVSVPAIWLVFTGTRYRALHSLILPAPLALLALLPSATLADTSRRWLGWTVVFFLGSFCLAWPAAVGEAHGGIEWGSRYALTAMVLLNGLGVAAVVDTWSSPGLSRAARWATTGVAIWLVLLGAASTARGVQELRNTRRDLRTLQTTLERLGDPVVTDTWWFGASLAPFAARHEVYTLSEMHPLREWLDLIGPRRPRFTFVGASPPDALFDAQGTPWIRQECSPTAGLAIARFHRGPGPCPMRSTPPLPPVAPQHDNPAPIGDPHE